MQQMDVKNAFLDGELQEEVYMDQTPGYANPRYPNHVCKLLKALYGTKQGSRAWYDRIAKFLVSIGFHRAHANHSLYEFEMKDLGELRYFLGIEIIKTPKGIWLSQRQYALDMLSKYGMADCKPIFVRLDVNAKLSAEVGDVVEDVTMYTKIVSSLIYLTITKPNLSYSVGLESQFMQLPRNPHLDAIRCTL
ncbi:hypothetical protein L7F22_058143 [Adiantum nelumboides]|nr:hypothetical protein [Adiantum nelumboides]